MPHLSRELENSQRLDLVWDRYLERSIKESTREKRGSGVRKKVSPETKMPGNWKDFLRDSANKDELFSFLSQTMGAIEFPQNKQLYLTEGTNVICKGSSCSMQECFHEEADTRIVVHLCHALETGKRKILVRTVDTDVVVILVGQFFSLLLLYPDMDLWVTFGMGKGLCQYHINTICLNLGPKKSRALPLYHAFSGCDTTSFFYNKGKKSSWAAWQAYPDATDAFLHMREHPFEPIELSSSTFQRLERLTVVMYDKTSNLSTVNEARRELFCKKNSSLENIPPTQVTNCKCILKFLHLFPLFLSHGF